MGVSAENYSIINARKLNYRTKLLHKRGAYPQIDDEHAIFDEQWKLYTLFADPLF